MHVMCSAISPIGISIIVSAANCIAFGDLKAVSAVVLAVEVPAFATLPPHTLSNSTVAAVQ